MTTLAIYPAVGATVYDELGGSIPSTGITVTLTDYYIAALRDGLILAYDPLEVGEASTAELQGGLLLALVCTDLSTRVGSFDGVIVITKGYSTLGDGGGGEFVWVQGSATTADNGLVWGATASGRWKRVYSGRVNVRWFGARGDGLVDDTDAIQDAIDCCVATGDHIYAPSGEYLITDTINLTVSGDMGAATLLADASDFSPALRVGLLTGTGNDAQLRLDLICPKVSNTAKVSTGWSGFSSAVGIQIPNLYESRVSIPYVAGFGIGVWCGGTTAGCVYNTFRLGMLWQNQIQLRVGQIEATGWANENLFEGGRFGYDSGEGSIAAGRSIQLLMPPGASGGSVNNNLFLRPSLEGDEPAFHLELADAAFNSFISARWEVPSGAPRIKLLSTVAGETTSNLILGGYRDQAFAVTRSGLGSPHNKVMGTRLCDAQEYSGCGVSLVNTSGNSRSYPHIQGFESDQYALDKTQASANWTYRLHSDGLDIKTAASTYPCARLVAAGRLELGAGSGEPDSWIRGAASANEIETNSLFYADGDSTRDLGFAGRRWRNLHITTIRPGSGGPLWTSGSGSPEGVVGADVGSLYTRTDGGAGTTLYVKESGSGNTGWVAK